MFWFIRQQNDDTNLQHDDNIDFVEEERMNDDFTGTNAIKMPVEPTLGITSTGHNISGVGILTPILWWGL